MVLSAGQDGRPPAPGDYGMFRGPVCAQGRVDATVVVHPCVTLEGDDLIEEMVDVCMDGWELLLHQARLRMISPTGMTLEGELLAGSNNGFSLISEPLASTVRFTQPRSL